MPITASIQSKHYALSTTLIIINVRLMFYKYKKQTQQIHCISAAVAFGSPLVMPSQEFHSAVWQEKTRVFMLAYSTDCQITGSVVFIVRYTCNEYVYCSIS